MARKASNKLAGLGGKHGLHDGVEAHPLQCRRAGGLSMRRGAGPVESKHTRQPGWHESAPTRQGGTR